MLPRDASVNLCNVRANMRRGDLSSLPPVSVTSEMHTLMCHGQTRETMHRPRLEDLRAERASSERVRINFWQERSPKLRTSGHEDVLCYALALYSIFMYRTIQPDEDSPESTSEGEKLLSS